MLNATIKRKILLRPKIGLKNGIEKALKEITEEIEKEAIRVAPVDRGDLKAGIGSSFRRMVGRIFSSVYYSIFQEFGTMFMAAANAGKGYLRLAVSKVRGSIPTIVGKHIRNEIRKTK